MPANEFLSPRPRPEIAEHEFIATENQSPIAQVSYDRMRFRFTTAKKVHFRAVSFKYCVFEDCYFRDCRFEDCDFTGATFRNSVLRGSMFDGSRFDYCRFAHSLVPVVILERHMPGYENVALELARALRVNYAQVGDSDGVNRAISAELSATRTHLEKVAWSNEGYYRNKHRGFERAIKVLEYYWFYVLDFVWGHGESLPKLLRTLILAYMVLVVFLYRSSGGFFPAIQDAFLLIWSNYGGAPQIPMAAAVTLALRTLLLGLFVAVLVRRLSRR
ncbi:MAG TPA: pentapeptide repeat-containing protein [Opitutaceae bacterium]|nr:pentapeptide repeat-containing protein [Opitutaceae bacterium]